MIYAIGLIILGLAACGESPAAFGAGRLAGLGATPDFHHGLLAPQWVCDPALTALFTPSQPEVGRYEICTTTDRIGDLVALAAADGAHFGEVEALEPLDAFGAAGPYNRAALAHLYGGSRVQVARGWAQRAGQLESVTLLSPYPDPSFTKLHAGTMAIRFTISRSPGTRGLGKWRGPHGSDRSSRALRR